MDTVLRASALFFLSAMVSFSYLTITDSVAPDGVYNEGRIVFASPNRDREETDQNAAVDAEVEKERHEEEPVEDDTTRSFSMAFVGDIMMDRGVRTSVENHGSGTYSYITQHLDFLREFDIVFGNLEGPVSDKGEDLGNLYSFRMDPAAITALQEANFSVLSVANNHAGDWGVEAFRDTLDRVEDAGILPVGGGRDREEAAEVKVVEVEGYTVGFVGFSDVGPVWLEAEENTPGILLAARAYHNEIIASAAEETDLLVVSYHYGEEYIEFPNSRQQKLARGAVELGADIVAGHHPHVIQPVEIYRDGVIAYSLGNFIFDQYFSEETMEGQILIVEVTDGVLSYKVKEVEFTEHFQPQLKQKYEQRILDDN